jgi:hypothetical protein
MRCLACGAEMRLVQVSLADARMAGLERHTFRCSSCSHISERLVLSGSRSPAANARPAARPPELPRAKLQIGRMTGSAPAKLSEKLRSRQWVAKGRAAAAIAATWAELFERLQSQDTPIQGRAAAPQAAARAEAFQAVGVQDRAAAARSSAMLKPVETDCSPEKSAENQSGPPKTSIWLEAAEKVRRRQRALQESPAATSSPVPAREQLTTTAADARARRDKKQPSRTWAEVVDELQRRQAAVNERAALASRAELAGPVRTSEAHLQNAKKPHMRPSVSNSFASASVRNGGGRLQPEYH